jgi:hypothetical protein
MESKEVKKTKMGFQSLVVLYTHQVPCDACPLLLPAKTLRQPVASRTVESVSVCVR